LRRGDSLALTKAPIIDSVSDQNGFPKNHASEILENQTHRTGCGGFED